MTDFQDAKRLVSECYAALDAAPTGQKAAALARFTTSDYQFRGVHPFNEIAGARVVAETVWEPFYHSLKPVQRRQDIFMAGAGELDGEIWVMSMGHLMGLLDEDWLGIPATGKTVFLRYADFNRISNDKIAESGFFCDIIGVMQQAGQSPLPQQTGAAFVVPGPQSHDGLLFDRQDPAEGAATLDLVNRMKDDLIGSYGTQVPPALLQKTWHDTMLWYGPAGIGSTYTIPRYQQQHQFPFRNGLTDLVFNGHVARFAEGNYAGWFGWPNLSMTPCGGFMGLPASDRRVDMRVVDVYRRDGDKLAENWVLIDMMHFMLQQGVDVLARMKELRRVSGQ